MQDIPMYNLVNLLENDIKVNFYQAELQAVYKSEDTRWNVEKIIRKRRRNNRTEVLVKWTGYSDRFNSWVDEADVKNM
jgi:pyruvate-formate lyase